MILEARRETAEMPAATRSARPGRRRHTHAVCRGGRASATQQMRADPLSQQSAHESCGLGPPLIVFTTGTGPSSDRHGPLVYYPRMRCGVSRGDRGRGRCGPMKSQAYERRSPPDDPPGDRARLSTDCRSGREEAESSAPRFRYLPRPEAAKERLPAQGAGDLSGRRASIQQPPSPAALYPRTSNARPMRRRQASRPSTSINSNSPGPPPTPVVARRRGCTRSPSFPSRPSA